jgi:NAD(P)-dependent dehydrogenase (short-subunit alcohol dehydrogenase family)
MSRRSREQWIVVTGATGGVGKALVARLVTDGRNVIATGRKPDRIIIPDGPGRMERVAWDADEPAAVTPAVETIASITADHGLHGLVNVAGIIVEGPLEALPPSDLRRQFEVNVVAPFALTQALLPALKRGRGRVVNIGAISAHLTPPFYGPIAASKSALSSLNDAMRLEFAPFGIRVILIEPGAMRTGIFATSRAARDACLARAPELERRYRPALAAMDRAFERAGGDDPEAIVSVVMRSLFARKPGPEVVVGQGSRAFVFLSRLPAGLRDRLVKNALGLTAALRPTT